MRTRLLSILCGGLGLLFAAALPASAKTPEDTLVMAYVLDELIGFDPAEIFEIVTGELSNNLYLRLLVADEADFTKIAGGVAESWDISADGKSFIFKMRKGLTFAVSGKPVTAQDAAFSLQRVVKLAKTPAFILTQFGWTPDNVDSLVKATDDQTLRIEIPEALAPSLVLNALSANVASVVEREVALANQKDNDLGHAWLQKHTAGAGAYKLVDWRPNETVVLEANKKFYRGAPFMDRIIVRHVPEDTTERLMLEKGDLDIARRLGAEQFAALAANKEFKLQTDSKTTVLYLGLNQSIPQLANPKVREALRWSIDYDGIASALLKYQYRAHQAILGKDNFAALEDQPYRLDVAKAKALLAEAGYPDGFKISLDVFASSPYKSIGEALQSSFAKVGIALTLNTADRRQTLTQYRARGHEIVLMYWSPDYADPHSTVDYFVRNPDNSTESKVKTLAWRNSWKDPALEAASGAAMAELDTPRREAAYLDIQRKLQKDSPMIVLFQQIETVAMRANVEGWISGPSFDTYIYRKIKK